VYDWLSDHISLRHECLSEVAQFIMVHIEDRLDPRFEGGGGGEDPHKQLPCSKARSLLGGSTLPITYSTYILVKKSSSVNHRAGLEIAEHSEKHLTADITRDRCFASDGAVIYLSTIQLLPTRGRHDYCGVGPHRPTNSHAIKCVRPAETTGNGAEPPMCSRLLSRAT
jgi:hypothetical protein